LKEIQETISTAFAGMGVRLISGEALAGLLILLLVGGVVVHLLMKLVDRMLNRAPNLASLRVYIRGGIRGILWFVLILMGAASIGIQVTSLIALFSVAGLAVSLALQNTLSNLAGGIQLLATQAFRVGDYIETEKGSGTVKEIGLSYTLLTTPDNKEILIPNNQMADSKIINYSAQKTRRVDIPIKVRYGSAPETIRKAAMELAARFPQIHGDPKPVVYLTAYQDSAVEYSLRVWVDTGDYWDVYFAMLEGVQQVVAEYGLSTPYPQMEVRHVTQRQGTEM